MWTACELWCGPLGHTRAAALHAPLLAHLQVLDEADTLLAGGFVDDITYVYGALAARKQVRWPLRRPKHVVLKHAHAGGVGASVLCDVHRVAAGTAAAAYELPTRGDALSADGDAARRGAQCAACAAPVVLSIAF